MHENNAPQKPAEAQPIAVEDPVIVESCPTCLSGVDATVNAPEFAEALTQDL